MLPTWFESGKNLLKYTFGIFKGAEISVLPEKKEKKTHQVNKEMKTNIIYKSTQRYTVVYTEVSLALLRKAF